MSEDIYDNRVDEITSFVKATLGIVPFAGGIFSEIICKVIPNQRIERICKFIEKLGEKLKCIDEDLIQEKLKLESYIDLFEDCVRASTRALTDERKEHISIILTNSITDEESNVINHKKMLYLLNQLDDIDLIHLKYNVLNKWTRTEASDYYSENKEILFEQPIYSGATKKAFVDRENYRVHIRHLRQLGLLQTKKGSSKLKNVENNELENMEATWLAVKLMMEIDELPESYLELINR